MSRVRVLESEQKRERCACSARDAQRLQGRHGTYHLMSFCDLVSCDDDAACLLFLAAASFFTCACGALVSLALCVRAEATSPTAPSLE